jgi:hypothetical protein
MSFSAPQSSQPAFHVGECYWCNEPMEIARRDLLCAWCRDQAVLYNPMKVWRKEHHKNDLPNPKPPPPTPLPGAPMAPDQWGC